jgi:UDP-N-acetylmuramate-alanine ligase
LADYRKIEDLNQEYNFMSSGVSIFDINNNIRPVFMIGVGGNGMSALAFWCLGQNTIVWGSDRSQNGYSNAIDRLCKAGLVIKPQDGSGITEFFELYPNGIVLATPAVEKSVPDYIESCRYFGVPLMRSEFLAHVFNNSPIGIAVAGSAGKSSVSAMIFFELYANMMDPSFISGSPVIGFNNGIFGKGPMVIEADESDLSMVNYNYNALVLLNLTREHHEIDLMIDKMSDFLINSRDNSVVVANIDCPNVMEVIKIYKHRLSEKIHKLPNPALRPRVVTFSASGNTKADFYISACDLVSYFPWKTRITLNSITISADSNKSQHSAGP